MSAVPRADLISLRLDCRRDTEVVATLRWECGDARLPRALNCRHSRYDGSRGSTDQSDLAQTNSEISAASLSVTYQPESQP